MDMRPQTTQNYRLNRFLYQALTERNRRETETQRIKTCSVFSTTEVREIVTIKYCGYHQCGKIIDTWWLICQSKTIQILYKYEKQVSLESFTNVLKPRKTKIMEHIMQYLQKFLTKTAQQCILWWLNHISGNSK